MNKKTSSKLYFDNFMLKFSMGLLLLTAPDHFIYRLASKYDYFQNYTDNVNLVKRITFAGTTISACLIMGELGEYIGRSIASKKNSKYNLPRNYRIAGHVCGLILGAFAGVLSAVLPYRLINLDEPQKISPPIEILNVNLNENTDIIEKTNIFYDNLQKIVNQGIEIPETFFYLSQNVNYLENLAQKTSSFFVSLSLDSLCQLVEPLSYIYHEGLIAVSNPLIIERVSTYASQLL